MARKDNFVKSLGLLAVIVGIAFFAFENRKVFGEALTNRGTTATGLKPEAPLEELKTPQEPAIAPNEQNNREGQIIQGVKPITPIVTDVPTPIVKPTGRRKPTPVRTPTPTAVTNRIQGLVDRANKQTLTLTDEFLTEEDIKNPKAFNKRKFGIDTDVLQRVVDKTIAGEELTLVEKKAKEAERATQEFDSKGITNF